MLEHVSGLANKFPQFSYVCGVDRHSTMTFDSKGQKQIYKQDK